MKQTVNQVKSVLVVLAMVLVSATTQAQDIAFNTEEEAAIVAFENTTIDYGVIEKDSNGERTFYFKNTGNAPLVLTNVKSSCGCTVPSYSKEPIMPGKEGQISVKYNTKKVGTFSKTITVTSNAKDEKMTLKIKGEVVANK